MRANSKYQDMDQYRVFRDKLILIMRQAQPLLNETAEILGREKINLPIEKLESNTFTLTLAGKFQCGKSTLFSYLCSGRELSPVGPGSGGIRTSGCRVTATALLDPQEEEFARVDWRSKDELLELICNALGLPSDEIKKYDLDDPSSRKELTKKLISDLRDRGLSERADFCRIALLALQFYPDYSKRVKLEQERMPVDDAIYISSYPQDWEPLWRGWKKAGCLHPEKFFSARTCSFVFCESIHYFIHSAQLEKLGCTVEDCPGLSASQWDDQIARNCYKQADAILYIFFGDKDIDGADRLQFKEFKKLDIRDRVFFGANIRGMTYKEWDYVVRNGVLPKLERDFDAYENPVVHAFHAAIALRGCQLQMEQCHSLPESTRQAILLNSKGKSVEDYLKHLLRKYLSNVLDKSLEDYTTKNVQIDFDKLEEDAGRVPAFVRAAQKKIMPDRAKHLLVDRGINVLVKQINSLEAELKQHCDTLNKTIDERREELTKREKAVSEFSKNTPICKSEIEQSMGLGIEKIHEWSDEITDAALQKYRKKLVNIIALALLELLKEYDADKLTKEEMERKARQFGANKLLQALLDILLELRDKHVKSQFLSTDGYKTISDMLEKWRKKLVMKAKQLEGLPNIAQELLNMDKLKISDYLRMAFNQAGLNDLEGIEYSFTRNFAERCFYFLEWFQSDEERAQKKAEEIYAKKMEGAVQKTVRSAFWNALDQGPVNTVRKYCKRFLGALDEPKRALKEEKERAQADLGKSEVERSKQTKKLTQLFKKLARLRKQGDRLKSDIQKKLLKGAATHVS